MNYLSDQQKRGAGEEQTALCIVKKYAACGYWWQLPTTM